MKQTVALALLASACVHKPQGPYAVVRLVDPTAWPEADRKNVETGALAWQTVGVIGRVELSTKLPICPNDWYKRVPQLTDCVIEIGLIREPGLMQNAQMMGSSDRVRDVIRIDASLKGFDIAHVIAHEVGHIVLNTSEHSMRGVMMSGGWEWVLSDEDKALACKVIQRGCK